ncbi:dj-1/pfpi [Lucifera butyrica]|uniref:Dj-1/pfpi n=1 Tax=Lucifera butyrica TaxID=1351585 RepID=A0A498R700_9FIRM|nr:DJ-1/PfpI family protein [Lucifera butyrica]VBB06690.1 dj-1/pfpi [Lucifera butyrica]
MLTIGILLFPQVEELDFIGPFEILSYSNKIQPGSVNISLVAESAEPVRAFNGLTILPDTILKKCPPLDIIVVPGGKGRVQAMRNPAIQDWLQQQAKTAYYITSVCTGAFLLAEAGLLRGRKATTHHAALAELANYTDVTVQKTKVVHDDRIITGAGVSSGLELGLYLLVLLFGKPFAAEVAQKIEYNINWEALPAVRVAKIKKDR